jgi:hypothetical protein
MRSRACCSVKHAQDIKIPDVLACMEHGGVWEAPRATFDNIFEAVFSLITMATGDGWLTVHVALLHVHRSPVFAHAIVRVYALNPILASTLQQIDKHVNTSTCAHTHTHEAYKHTLVQIMGHATDAVRVGISPVDMYRPAASLYIVVYVLVMYCLLMHGLLAAVLEEYMHIKAANGGLGFMSPDQVRKRACIVASLRPCPYPLSLS